MCTPTKSTAVSSHAGGLVASVVRGQGPNTPRLKPAWDHFPEKRGRSMFRTQILSRVARSAALAPTWLGLVTVMQLIEATTVLQHLVDALNTARRQWGTGRKPKETCGPPTNAGPQIEPTK